MREPGLAPSSPSRQAPGLRLLHLTLGMGAVAAGQTRVPGAEGHGGTTLSILSESLPWFLR